MRASRTITVGINREAGDVYRFLAAPVNYPRWAPVVGDGFTKIDTLTWQAELPFGPRTIRFSPFNNYGVLDHSEQAPGQTPIVNPMRVLAGPNAAHLVFTFYRRDEMDDVQFRSAIEWIHADLLAFKSLMELPR